VTRTKEAQAKRIVDVLSGWLSASPGERSVTIKETREGWRATLEETRSANGSTALDALAQVATAAEMETER
jgi:hypothetical protein